MLPRMVRTQSLLIDTPTLDVAPGFSLHLEGAALDNRHDRMFYITLPACDNTKNTSSGLIIQIAATSKERLLRVLVGAGRHEDGLAKVFWSPGHTATAVGVTWKQMQPARVPTLGPNYNGYYRRWYKAPDLADTDFMGSGTLKVCGTANVRWLECCC